MIHQSITILLFGTYVSGHAVMLDPSPWNRSPSKSSPCGGVNPPTMASASWVAGAQVSVTWSVIAGDGSGPVSFTIDQSGGTANFSRTLQPADSTGIFPAPAVGTYLYTLNVPRGLNCTGGGDGNNFCTLMAASSSNWFSCTYIQIFATAPPVPDAPPTPSCIKTNTAQAGSFLTFCNFMNGQYVEVQPGFTASAVDQATSDTFKSYSANPNVFFNGNDTTNCQPRLKKALCELALPPCTKASLSGDADATSKVRTDSVLCQETCNSTMAACGITVSHAALYNCSTLKKCTANVSAGTRDPLSFTWIASTCLILLAICSELKTAATSSFVGIPALTLKTSCLKPVREKIAYTMPLMPSPAISPDATAYPSST
ncbi:hypothetical protein BJ742DRAFT_742200 [Cladochytrium replicatum]|nr:hypothetical protein BJ742DRAFT_742200 [Cladochytrium replicatum]